MELSSKVLDRPDRLRRTLVHELCHVAAWLIDHTSKPPHGSVSRARDDNGLGCNVRSCLGFASCRGGGTVAQVVLLIGIWSGFRVRGKGSM